MSGLREKGALSVNNNKIARVKTWEEFKQLIAKYNPRSIAYNIEQGVPARQLTSLRLILPVERAFNTSSLTPPRRTD